MAEISKFVDTAYEQRSFAELVKAPVSVLQGVSDGDGMARAQRSRAAGHGALERAGSPRRPPSFAA